MPTCPAKRFKMSICIMCIVLFRLQRYVFSATWQNKFHRIVFSMFRLMYHQHRSNFNMIVVGTVNSTVD